jgi:hypothetical protein
MGIPSFSDCNEMTGLMEACLGGEVVRVAESRASLPAIVVPCRNVVTDEIMIVLRRKSRLTRLESMNLSNAAFMPKGGPQAHVKLNPPAAFTATVEGIDRALYAVSLDGKQRLVSRVPGELTLQDIRADGAVLVTRGNTRRRIMSSVAGLSKEQDLAWFDWSYPVSVSADGKWMLFYEVGEGGGLSYTAYIRATDGSPAVRLGEG